MEPVPFISHDDLINNIIRNKKQALKEARKYRAGLIFWTDGSKLDQGNTGAAVCWKDKALDRWKEKSIFLGKNKEILDVELWAIWKALEIALRETTNMKNVPVTLFYDSQKALKEIIRPSS